MISYINYTQRVFYKEENWLEIVGCKFTVSVSLLSTSYQKFLDKKMTFQEAVNQGFDIEYEAPEGCSACKASGGVCGSSSTSQFVCFCKD